MTWFVIPESSAVPSSGTGDQTPLITFTNQGDYEIVFAETNTTSPSNCTIPTTAQSSTTFRVDNNPQNCPLPSANEVQVMPFDASISAGEVGSFELLNCVSCSNIQWFITPQLGVSPLTGTGPTTGTVQFDEPGLYRVTYVFINIGNGTCIPTQGVASGLISVGVGRM